MSAELSDSERVVGRPFPKGVSGNPGGTSKKLQRVRKKLEKFDEKAMDTLKALFDSDQLDIKLEALKFWGKYRLPVPKETKDERDARAAGHPTLPPALAARLAGMQ